MAASFPTNQAIVVGGGLGGMSAANTVVENGGRVILLDKSSFCGGNSTKATSGINGAGTKTQKAKGIPDNAEIFTQDTMKGGAKKPELAKLLCVNSAADVDWLVEKFNLDLSLVARLGGHSQPRTHRGKERFPGMTITYALIQMLEKVAEKTDLARIVTKAKVFKLVTEGNACVGCVYEKGGQNFQEFGPVILASGGFGADFTSNSLLAQYRPDLLHLPTTNGEHRTGDGIKMGEAIGAKSIDLEWVQVHPTGLVKPDDADAKIKFLAAEALRGVGGTGSTVRTERTSFRSLRSMLDLLTIFSATGLQQELEAAKGEKSLMMRQDLEHTFLESAADCVSRALQVVDGAMAQGVDALLGSETAEKAPTVEPKKV